MSKKEEKQPAIPTPQNADIDSVCVKVENSDSSGEQPTKPPPIQNIRGSFLTCHMPVPKPVIFLICSLLFVCVAPVVYAFITLVTAAILPLLLAAFVVLRMFQFIAGSETVDKQFVSKFLLRYWTLMGVMLFLVEVGIFYPFAKYYPSLKSVMVIGLPITKWICIICILIGIYLISQLIWVSIIVVLFQVFGDEDDITFTSLLDITSEIIDCLLLLWAEVVVMSSVPTFAQSKILGIDTRQWIKVSLFVLIGYNIIRLVAHIFVWSLPKIYGDHLGVGESLNPALSVFCCDDLSKSAFSKKYVVYAASGIKRSIIFILSMLMLLITWVLYFDNRLNITPLGKRVSEMAIWTFVSLLICSFLWLIKSCILLYWETRVIYGRLDSKITDMGKQLYFLILLCYIHYEKVYESPVTLTGDSGCWLSCYKTPPKKKVCWVLWESNSEVQVCRTLDRRCVRTELIDHTGPKACIHQIQKAAEYFLTAQYALSKETAVCDIHHLQANNSEDDNSKCIEILTKIVKVEGGTYFDKDWEMLLKLLPDVTNTEDITYQKVRTFMERAHSRCTFLSNTLISEKKAVKCLNHIVSGLIIAGVFIMWLLLTGLATTKVIVLIASPLLAATFIFGDTAKNLFQGLIFIYIVHPFDVGDLCLIDEKLLEVKRIGVWSTIFSNIRNIGEQQQIIYPNSVLALKNIINHKTNFDWHDRIEFLSTPDKKIIEPLILQIQTYLNDEDEKFVPKFHGVKILEIGDKAKIVVYIRHKLPTTEGWTHFECLKEKEKRSLEFNIYVLKIMKQLELETETPVVAASAVNEKEEIPD